MKRLTTFLLALMLFTLGASAQTDFTWALNAGTWTADQGNGPNPYSTGTETYCDGTTGYIATTGKVLYCTVSDLPAGTYTVSFYAASNSCNSVAGASGDNLTQVYANDATAALTVGTLSSITLGDAYLYTLECTVGSDGVLEFGITNIASPCGNWYVAQGISLIYSETYVAVPGDKVYGCKAEIGHWTATNTGSESFQKNTWSNAEGMSVPTCEYWVYNTSNLTAATLSHETLTGLQAGTYEVSIAASATAENNSGSVGEGTTFNVNGVSVDMTTGTAGTRNYHGTYTVEATIGDEGTLDISFTIPSGVTYNWLQFQDLSVTLKELAAEVEPEPEPEDTPNDYQPGDVITVDGVEYTVQSDNIVENHSFELGFTGWTDANDFTTEITSSKFDLKTDGAEDGEQYLVGTTNSGSNSDGSLGKAWAIEANKTYYFFYWIKNLDETEETEYLKTSLTNTPGTETKELGYPASVSADWQKVEYVFDSESYEYVQVKFRWLENHWGFDNFQIYEVEAPEVEPEPEGTYEFVAEDWVASDNGRASADVITYNADNTITVAATGANNIALGNNPSQWWDASNHDVTTADYTITKDQSNFVIIGSDLATGGTDSYWWWMNGINDWDRNNGQIAPDEVYELSDGQVMFVWDLTYDITNNMTVDENGLIALNGVTCFGLTTTGTSSTISDINFYTDEELEAIIAGDEEPEPTPEPVVEEGEYLIVDAEGYYLGGGLTYGTQAATIGKPQFINFEVQENGTYHLDAHQYNNATAHYLGANLYFDNATPVDWTVAEVDGGYTIYGTVEGGTGYLTSNGFQTVPTVEADPYVWTLLTIEDVIAGMDEATADAPVDVTALIAAPELKRNSNSIYYPTWTVTGYDGTGTPSNYAFGGGSAIANCAESYHSTNGFNFSQEITLPLAGTYTLSAQGFYRDDNSTTLLLPVMYAGDQTSTFPEITRTDEYLGVDDNMANAYQEFLLGLHPIDAITITAKEDGETVTIGFKGEDTSLWQIMGELTLLYSGEAEAEPEDLSELIAQYEADCTAAEECEANLADMIENGDKTDETKAEMAEALEALEAVMEQYGNIDTTNTTAEELTEAIEAIEAALAEAQDVYTTGLQSVTVATEEDAIYTLGGVRVSKAVKGVYIVNGKKVLVK